jgi:hypothetical protein
LDLRDEETQIIPTSRRTFRQAYNAEVGVDMGDLLTLEDLAFQRPDNRSNCPGESGSITAWLKSLLSAHCGVPFLKNDTLS